MRSEARIIDANRNRALEGLRVLEDVARFALDDPALSGRCKAARHGLAEAVGSLPIPAGLGLAARDSAGDVGATIHAGGEMRREGLAAIVAAAGGRAAEAVRTIEEMAKAVGGGDRVAARVKAIRYEVYELSRLIAAGLVPVSPQWRLCVLLTGSMCPGEDWERVAQAAIAGGADCLQLREKDLGDRAFLERAQRVVELARSAPRRVWVVINDRPDIALLAGADAVHVGQDDLSPAHVRAVVGQGIPVGVSTSSIEQAVAAARAGASSVGLGPMFETTTKHKPTFAGEAYLRAFLADERVARLPHLCIGGITPDNAASLVAAGARGLAVSSAVCRASDPEAVCRALVSLLDGASGAPA